mmetsp:Transcript_23034/g.50554  ORF Transcript_23034/g.50554 Transcript_23034/m.50554 type:complete len:305 (+) Transcript_23034:150-1064(+)|eukprot:CAMPEP_0202900386 /NCGR_PEP_ID=MMETSP1392-20130828/11421_1 /ASSEMBLY_ACC=CAM_ASM_000868 /TAXON_ID=225041 /ORGANISM="Chlamydomonas chlamydogama, Strain SAG 11-48b" /LENGTH=304 /DNA_ID=CAMNT_0049586765 /DNA_START=150 /DNA_END=1064 /DNA_ORIENTATION=+
MAQRVSSTPTQAELDNLAVVPIKLWQLDENRVDPGEYYELNLQGGKSIGSSADAASEKLFTRVNKKIWEKPTYKLFYSLLNNYSTKTGQREEITAEEQKEMHAFLDAILATRPMKYCHKFCVKKGTAPADLAKFKEQLYQMWFSLYRRDGDGYDSSGFEHVFVGESDEGKISGFHNWIQFWIEEASGRVDYRGYIWPRLRSDRVDAQDRLISVQLAWNGEIKPVSTFFMGTSPEFEFALYTLFFLNGQEYNEVELGVYDLAIRCYGINSKYGDKIGSVFPELLREDLGNKFAKLDMNEDAAPEA